MNRGLALGALGVFFALAVMATVALAKRMPVGAPVHTAPEGVAHART